MKCFVPATYKMSLIRITLVFYFAVDCLLSKAEIDDQVVQLNILYRHGDRSPTGNFPSNPINESWWPGGYGQLTQRGMDQHYQLGQYLRKRYIEGNPYRLLSPFYDRHEITIRSTDIDRALMSAYSNLAGLFPPDGSQQWNHKIDWQPIPVHTVPTQLETLLLFGTCPKYQKAYNELLKNESMVKEKMADKEFYDFVASSTGLPNDDNLNTTGVFDALFCQKSHGLPLPAWINTTFNGVTVYDKLRVLVNRSYELMHSEQAFKRFRGGKLLGTVVDNMKSIVTGTSQTSKCFMYSAHDITVAGLTSAMNVFNGIWPPYTTAVLVELIKSKDNEYFVNVLYRNDSNREPYPLTVPGCRQRCPFTDFVHLLKDNIPSDLDAECQINYFEAWMSSKVFVSVLSISCVILSLVICCFTLIAVLRCRRRIITKRYSKLALASDNWLDNGDL